MNEYVVKAPTHATWEGFEAMAAQHNGVFGGCPRSWFHTLHDAKTLDADDNVALTRRLDEEGRTHAWLVNAGDEAVAWAECVRAGFDCVRSESQGICVMRRTV